MNRLVDSFAGELGPWRRLRKRSRRKFDEAVKPFLRAIWDSGDWDQKLNVLDYLVVAQPPESLQIAWEALHSDDSSLRGEAVIAVMRSIHHGYLPTDAEKEMLLRLVRSQIDRPTTREFAFMSLEHGDFPGIEELLAELASDASPDVRFDANIRLLRRGHNVKEQLFADLDLQDYVDFAVERLWRYRHLLDLSSEQEGMLRQRLLGMMERSREYCRSHEPYSNSALSLFSKIKSGLPSEEGDIDLIGEAASYMMSSRERLLAVKALSWFGNDRARQWLEKLLEAPHAAVRREAQRQLRKLSAEH